MLLRCMREWKYNSAIFNLGTRGDIENIFWFLYKSKGKFISPLN